jgi:hypothetical protein
VDAEEIIYVSGKHESRSQWPRSLRLRFAAVGCWDRGFQSRSAHGCLYVVLSCVGRGLCDELITRPDDSYRVSNCV